MGFRLNSLPLLVLIFLSLAVAQDAAQRSEISSKGAGELLLTKIAPVYPPLARQARIQGIVVLKITINESGEVQTVRLLSGHPMLAPAAIQAVHKWQYQPYTLNGEPVEVETTVQVNFRLADDPPNAAPSGNAGRVRVSEEIMRPLRIQQVDPEYPTDVIGEGIVNLDVFISQSGDVENIKAISGYPIFIPAAIEAVKHWRYRPYTLNGSAVPVVTSVQITFRYSSDQNAGTVGDTPIPSSGPVFGIVSSAPPSGVPLPKRILVSAPKAESLLENKVAPQYPEEAKSEHIQGNVMIHVNIDAQGNVVTTEIVSGPEMLTQAALDAVKQWKYRPYRLNDTPIAMDTVVRVEFSLEN